MTACCSVRVTLGLTTLQSLATALIQRFKILPGIDAFATVFPNPVSNHLNIAGISDGSTLLIFDQTGKKIFETKAAGMKTLDVNNFSPGMYLLEIKDGNSQLRKKFIKL